MIVCFWCSVPLRERRGLKDRRGVALPPHELPEQREGEGSIPCVQVLTCDADQREFGLLLSQLDRVVAVLQLHTQHSMQTKYGTFLPQCNAQRRRWSCSDLDEYIK